MCLKVYVFIPLAPGIREKSLLVGSKVLFLPTEKVFTTRDTVFTLIYQLLCEMVLANFFNHIKEK